MISFEDALSAILAEARDFGSEAVPLGQLAGRVLATDVLAKFDVPAFDNSAMDGYAVRCPVSGRLRVVGEIKAGDCPNIGVQLGTAVRVFTGAAMPEGADAVVMQEHVSRSGDVLTVLEPVAESDYVRVRGEEIGAGDRLASAGTLATPPVVGSMAATGIDSARVWKRPRVAVVETGSELIEPGDEPAPGSVFASNGVSLAAAVEACGCIAMRQTASDEPQAIRDALGNALAQADIVITSGGVSVGDYDLVRPALIELGVRERFWKVAIRPGRPFWFGTKPDGAVVFGLPGNPGSALVTFLALVRPLILECLGRPARQNSRLTSRVEIRASETVETLLRVTVSNGIATPVDRQGSNMISSVMLADALLRIPKADKLYPAGSEFEAIPVAWSL